MTAKGEYTSRARIREALTAAPETGLSAAEIALRVYGKTHLQECHAVIEIIRLLRRQHGTERIQTILRPDRTTGRNRAYYRWIPETA